MHIIHMEDGLMKTIAGRADAYDGPISSETGKLLWAVQSWYAEMENEKSCEVILAAHDSECVLAA